MTVRPANLLVQAIGGLALLTPIAFFWWPITIPVAVAATALAAAAIQDGRKLRSVLAEVELDRTLPAVIGRDVPFTVTYTVVNGSPQELCGELRDEHPRDAVPPLVFHPLTVPGGNSATSSATPRIPRRGRHEFGKIWLRVRGPLSLLEGQRGYVLPGGIDVLPETFVTRERMQKDLGAELRLLDKIQRSRQHGTGTEFESLYPYRLGDDPRRIDWRATARQRSLVVRRFQVERHRDVMIIVDCGRLMGAEVGQGSKLDCAVDAGLNLARVVLQSGDRCGIAAYDRRVRGFLPPIAGSTALRSLVNCVYALQTEWQESDFTPMLAELRSRQAKRTFLIVLSDLSDAETSRRMCASLVQLQRQHLVLFAALRTPLLDEIVAEPIQKPPDVARKAVVFRLLRDRRRALHALSRGGVHVVDVEPAQLTVPLINQFIELRTQNLL